MQYVNESVTHTLRWGTLLALLGRYRWLILAIFFATVLTGLVTLQVFFTDLYETQSAILIKIGRENAEVPSTVVHGSVLSQGVRVQDINSEVQILSDRHLIEQAVDKVGLERFRSVLPEPTSVFGYPKYWLKIVARFVKAQYKEVLYAVGLKKRLTFREEVVVAVSEALKVEPVKESDVLVLKLRLPSPQLAVDTANEILAGYRQSHAEIRRGAAARSYYAEQAKDYHNRLQGFEGERARIRDKWGLSSANEQRTLLLKQLTDLEVAKVEFEGQLRKLMQEQEDLSAKLAALPSKLTKEETFMRNPALESMKERITSLQMERARLLGRYVPNSQTIAQLDTEIAALESSLRSENPTILSSTVSQTNPLQQEFTRGILERQVAIAGLRSRLAKLAEPIRAAKTQLEALNFGGDAYERAERNYRVAEQSYLAFYKRMSEAQLSEDLDQRDISNVTMLSPPSLPIEPVYPRKLFIMGILLPVGLLLGIGVAALMETMNDRIRNQADLLAVENIPYLGTVGSSLELQLLGKR